MCAALYLELLVAAIFGGKKAGMAQLPGGATEGRETYRYAASSYRAKSNEGELRKEDLKSTCPIVSSSQTLSLSRERERGRVWLREINPDPVRPRRLLYYKWSMYVRAR